MITITFLCGHTREMTGNEAGELCCGCGERQVTKIDAPAPRFTGHVQGPHAEFKNLDPQPVTFEK
jgi:hypothetical protein